MKEIVKYNNNDTINWDLTFYNHGTISMEFGNFRVHLINRSDQYDQYLTLGVGIGNRREGRG